MATAKKKKTPVKKTTAKKISTKKSAPVRKTPAIASRYNKTQILTEIAENTDLSKKDVAAVLEELGILMERHVKKRSCGEFVLPGLLKIEAKKKPARKAQKNVANPFRPGETMDIAAKPASVQIKVKPLKKLKEMAL